jgi:solute carrier family 13 (sodium-dependent dicarboxylate transporter), member 2/3/5
MRNPRLLALVAGPLLCLLVAMMDTPAGLTLAGQRSLAVLALCVTWWVFTPVGLPVTSIMGLALLPLMGAMEASQAFALFGNQAVFFVIGVFLVAAVMMETGLSSRISLLALRRLAKNENQLCNGVLFVSWGLCAVVVSHAVAALMLPIVLELVRTLDLGLRSRTAKRLLLSMAWGTVAGSNLTLLSSARATLSLELYTSYLLENGLPAAPIGFLEYSLGAVPISVASVVMAAIVLRLVFPPQGLDLGPALAQLDARVSEMGRLSRREISTLGVVAAMIVSIVLFGREQGMGTVALFFSAILFSMQTLKWEDAERYVNWGVAMMYGGAIAIGSALHSSGATTWLIAQVMPSGTIDPWLALGSAVFATAGMTELVSNSAVIAVVMPVLLPVAEQVSLDPRVFAWSAPISAGLAFMLPTSTPALAMVFGTGHLRIRHTLPGVVITLFSLIVFLVAARWLWPLVGLPVNP